MAATFVIRRMRIVGLAPHDHPAPHALETGLADAARRHLPAALEKALRNPAPGLLRIRRLNLDLTLDGSADLEAFSALLAGAIAEALESAGTASDNVVAFADPAAYLVALVEALAAGHAGDCWWFRDRDGLRFLTPAAAIRTALLEDPALGRLALLRLSPARLAAILATLGTRECERILDAVAVTARASVSAGTCAAAIAEAGAAPGSDEALALYLRASMLTGIDGPELAGAARFYAAVVKARDSSSSQDREKIAALVSHLDRDSNQAARVRYEPSHGPSALDALRAVAGVTDQALADEAASELARRILAEARRATASDAEPQFSRFAGLALLAPGLDFEAVTAQLGLWPQAPGDGAALVAFAALGLCAGRRNFSAWLREPVWRALFGLDPHADPPGERLAAVPAPFWRALEPLGVKPASAREARFLLAPQQAVGSAASRALASLANAVAARFARRLIGLRSASAPFLWENLLGAGGVFERLGDGWRLRLSRPSLDVLLSLSRLAEGEVRFPAGAVQLIREAP